MFKRHFFFLFPFLIAVGVLFNIPSIVFFATTTDTVIVNLEINAEDETSTTGGSVSGCTDSVAINFNPNAVISTNTCLYAGEIIPNAINFQAVYEQGPHRIRLTWLNPVFPNFANVRIMRSPSFFPTSPNEGELVYEGTGQIDYDYNIQYDQTYYYTLFVRSTSGAYSSGVVDLAVVPPLEEVPPEVPVDVFDPLPLIPSGGSTFDFIFVQPSTDRQIFRDESTIFLVTGTTTTVYVPYNRFPQDLKAIGVTIFDPNDSTKTFSFLLRANAEKTYYSATFDGFKLAADYPVSVYIVNYKNQTLEKLDGVLEVRGPSLEVLPEDTPTIALSLAGGVGLFSALAGLGLNLFSVLDLYLLVLRWFGSALRFFGFRKKENRWGTVYDALTKRPIDPAYVTVYRNDDLNNPIATAITDIDGRYGFLLPEEGMYVLKVNKTHYQFPSKILAGRTSDELYDNLYFGEPFFSKPDVPVNLNIPLDPIDFDWNEATKSQTSFFQIYSEKALRQVRILRTITALGFFFTLVALIITPHWFNIAILLSYLIVFMVEGWRKIKNRAFVVRSRLTGKPIPFAIVRAFYADLKQEAKHVVTDVAGRCYILVRPGDYYFTVEQRQPNGTYSKIHEGSSLTLTKGILTKDILA